MGFLDVRDRVSRLNVFYRTSAFGGLDKARTPLARQIHQELDDMATPEPDEELEDSELSEVERRAASARPAESTSG